MSVRRRSLLAGALALPLVARAQTQESYEQRKDRLLHEDFPELSRYAADNARILASGEKVNIVFMGDSITEGWKGKRPGFFTPGRVGRGISGQTTPQMVLRMMADVVHLKPRFVHIMAGTNDIAGNTGKMTREQSYDNFRMMAQIARANGIGVILASVPPADHFPWRPGLDVVGPIRAINAWLQGYAKSERLTWVDYTPVLGDAKGAMKPGFASDGVHPTEAGYDAMATVIEPILKARHA
ncbi:GDSL-type esterase/lipase family protein [uncultured Sphingomonas sp.]|uniref:GDSL-type esterase/lipase family protein n=1 Tax=uncultured Sphingomonas sp. TaxID=158754 RepID=UPI0025EFAF38|nr:GDSL-type esterase/lipase family protein [uncultured Sphingomonas sp.]